MVVDWDDMGMVEPPGDLDFLSKTLVEIGLFGHRGPHHLERDQGVLPGVNRLVDHRHAARADPFVDMIRSKPSVQQ